MTAPLNTPPAGAAKDAASARKRRRRAPAGGAADDCFTCAKRNVKCDRRRPYCSQCLEIGNECSGYKTQLTWGVGVASRGKLRGLSLPIAKAPPVNPGKAPKLPPKIRTTTSTTQWTEPEENRMGVGRDEMDMTSDRTSSVPPQTPFLAYDMSHMSPTEPSPAPWHHMPHMPHMPYPTNMSTSMPSHEPPRYAPTLQIPVSTPGEMLGTSFDSMSEVDYLSPLGHSFPREDVHSPFLHSPAVTREEVPTPFLHSPTVLYDSYPSHNSPAPQSPVSAIMIEHTRAPTSCPSLVYCPSEPSSSIHSHASHVETIEAQLSRKVTQESDIYGVPHTPELDVYGSSAQSHGTYWAPSNADEESVSHSLPDHNPAPWPMSFASPASPVLRVSPDLITKMPFFMDYYEKTMCPGMVFMDSPSNPFREHILQLGATSRSLQHAICALAACNLRMKRKLSLGQHGRDTGDKRLDTIDSVSDGQPEDQSLSEEFQHRNIAVQLLNEQLNDPDKSTHDSVLATILLLCHYRMAESGVAKFQTQFAGVKKILGMRRLSPFPTSREATWMETVFTYLDALSASTNDRESQLTTSVYGMIPETQILPPGSENLVGCDRELFKTITKLGRLNLLSRQRPSHSFVGTAQRTTTARASSPLSVPSFKPEHSIFGGVSHTSSSVRFDGSGFSTSLEEDEVMHPLSPMNSPPSTSYDDHRNTFWREWKDARIALQSWEFDASRVVASLLPTQSASPPTGAQVRDLGSLSEAFRYAALLYTERLASPNVPSAHSNFRNLVSQVVYYATSLEAGSGAEKFLLWPLFVAGSECVNELQQNIVRSKCREIMARSGYMNNLAALEVLERMWAGDWKEEASQGRKMSNGSVQGGGPFNWSKFIGGPGVDVEWLMF